jgi:hypothetical protein
MGSSVEVKRARDTTTQGPANTRYACATGGVLHPRESRWDPIAFESSKTRRGIPHALAPTDNRYKLTSQDEANTYQLYDLMADPGRTTDLGNQKPSLVAAMKAKLDKWQAS